MTIDETSARIWCESMSRLLTVQYIRPQEKPYLERYYAAGWRPGTKEKNPAIYLHHFVASDPDIEVHSHPWGWSLSLILVGGYREQRCGSDRAIQTKEYRPGDVNMLGPDDMHRIDLLDHDCWSLFLAGSFFKPWGFAPSCQ